MTDPWDDCIFTLTFSWEFSLGRFRYTITSHGSVIGGPWGPKKLMPPRPGLLDPSASPCDVWRPETGGPPFRCFQPGIVGRDLSDFFWVKQQQCGGKRSGCGFFHIFPQAVFLYNHGSLWQFALRDSLRAFYCWFLWRYFQMGCSQVPTKTCSDW